MRAIFTDVETNSIVFRLNNPKPLNKFFWEKEKATHHERLAQKYYYCVDWRKDKEKALQKIKVQEQL